MADLKDEELASDIIKDMSGMEVIEVDEYVDDEADFEDDTGLVGSSAALVRSRYYAKGQPDWNAFKVTAPLSIEYYDQHGHEVENDFYLQSLRPDSDIAAVNNRWANHYRDYDSVDGYSTKESDRSEYIKQYGPRLADSGGGKGVSTLIRSVVMQGVGMSGLLNLPIATGCSAVCNFCLESIVGHTFSESDISEADTGILDMTYEIDGESFHFNGPGKTRVIAYDPENDIVVALPLQTALAAKFPITKRSLRLISDEWGRPLRRNIAD